METQMTNLSPETLTADEAAFVANYVERWRKINAHFVSEYERRMDRRQGVCISGCDPTPYTMPTDERLTANAMEEVALKRQVARLKPQQHSLDRIADVIDAKLSRAVGDVLRGASHDSNPARVIDAAKLDALATLFPELRRDLAEAKSVAEFMGQIVKRAA
jgi:hypothetical protein